MDLPVTPERAAERLARVECPGCHGVGTLALEYLLVAKPFGTYSLAGAQPKVAAYEWPYLVCAAEGCGFAKAAKKEG
jgi:hypothetical protein